jgi:hypothetical protein
MEAFVVYELQPARSRRDTDDLVGERLPVKQPLQLVGCFIAENEGQAIKAAAESQQRAAHFIAMKAQVQEARFTAAEDPELKALSGLATNDLENLKDALQKLLGPPGP